MPDTFPWNPDQIATCIKMHLAGDSASVIGKHFGITRNAVIGKVSRLKAAGNCPHLSEEVIMRKKHTCKLISINNAKRKKPITVKRSRLSNLIFVAVKKAAPKPAPAPTAPKLVLVHPASPEPVGDHAAPLRYMRRNGCRYITEDFKHGSGDEAVMCGDQQVEGSAFCAHHKTLILAPHTETVRRSRWRSTVRQTIHYADKYA